MPTDLQLLSRYHLEGDSSAFRDLVQSHAGMVFATAQRITRDAAMAEDVAQETFFQLARQSRNITQSVAAWLHRVAWRRACNAVRDDTTRRRIEEEAAVTEATLANPAEHESTWAEVETVLDEVVDELPDNIRETLVMHFLQGRSQREISGQIGVSQSTVSRQIEEGLSLLRARLKMRGVLCGAGLAALLAANSATAAPAALLASLGKLSMTGIGAVTTSTPIASGTAAFPWMKAGVAVLVAAGGYVAMTTRQIAPVNIAQPVVISPPATVPPAATALSQSSGAASVAVPTSPSAQATSAASAPRLSDPAYRPTPVHELVHSFPKQPMHPCGHLAMTGDGWLWGVVTSGGEYGLGAIYKMRGDGSDWQMVTAFNGIQGTPRGSYPRGGLTIAPDGNFWGVTESGGASNGGTLYRFDPRTGVLTTEVEFDRVGSPWSRPWIAPDGQVRGTTYFSIYRFDPTARKSVTVARFSRKTGRLRGGRTQAGLTADGRGFLWGATGEGGSADNGTIFKLNLATGDGATVIDFTGKDGAFIGKQPLGDLFLGSDGLLWGTTRNGGTDDNGTVFKIAPATGEFTHVASFTRKNGAGSAPETQLAADGNGGLWGTTSYGGQNGHGTIYRVNAATGELQSVVALTGMEGKAMGGPARGDLLPDGAGGFFGVCDFGGRSWLGVAFHLDAKSGAYSIIKDMADTAENLEGSDPRGTLVSDTAGWLWGGTIDGGTHQAGTIYKFDPVTNELVTVVNFAGAVGTTGPCRGKFSGLPLVRDGKGFLWGSTNIGQSLAEGTIFKVDERTGEYTEVLEISSRTMRGVSAPTAGLTFDKNGFLWAASSRAVVKIDPVTRQAKTVGVVPGSWQRGALAMDGEGMLWGCTQGLREQKMAAVFKIDPANDNLITLRTFNNADTDWNGWNPTTDMCWDGKGSMWLTGIFDVSTGSRQCTLFDLDTRTGDFVGSHRNQNFRMINSPVLDERGIMWGTGSQFGFGSPGYIYTFDTRTREFSKLFEFTGIGSQSRTGAQADTARLARHTDGNFYGMTRMGGPGNGGTIYRLRFGPTPMTQEAIVLGDGRVELHGTLRANGRDSVAAFEWGSDPALKDAKSSEAGVVRAGELVKSVQAVLSGLPRGVPHYFRLRGTNPDNTVPQRGAILSFVVPEEAPNPNALADNSQSEGSKAGEVTGAAERDAANAAASAGSAKHRLRIVMVPGAGAGIVQGWLRGEAYEIGRSYTLTAQADNGYVFAQWSGAGITGAAAANPQLSFVFTPELAKRPFITATFVKNPFHPGLLGEYRGLVYPVENVQASISTIGALEMKIEPLGVFSGTLHCDGEDLPVAGVFDTGGSARFGSELAFIASISHDEGDNSTLLLSLQLDLSENSAGLTGYVGGWNGKDAVWRSQMHAVLNVPATALAADEVIQHLSQTRSLDVEIVSSGTGAISPAKVLIQPDGRLQITATLPDGTPLLTSGDPGRDSTISFFQLLDPARKSSFGIALPLSHLLRRPQEAPTAQGWWLPPDGTPQTVILQAAPPPK